MNKIFAIKLYFFLILLILPLASFAQDSIKVVPLNSKQNETLKAMNKVVSYPVLIADDSHLGKLKKSLDFETAVDEVQSQLTQAKRKKKTHEIADLENQLKPLETYLSSLQATNKIVFIDSVVVDKANFLSAYKFDEELGKIAMSEDKQSTSFVNELGNFMLKSEKNADGTFVINSYFIEDGKASNKSSLNGIEFEGDMNYPFLLADGTTFYFASRSEEGHGNYDIYVTRYDSEDGTYLQPTNLGYPFNSYANDYLMVVDEDLGIGWFASDRNQAEGKVCIYTFLQPKSRKTYDYDEDSHSTIIRAAKIASIKDTWKGNEDAIRTARQQLVLKQNANNDNAKKYDFSFVINNNFTYHSLSDFKSNAAKEAFAKYQKQQEELQNLIATLKELRVNAKGATIKNQIIQMEAKIQTLNESVHSLEKEVRKLELE